MTGHTDTDAYCAITTSSGRIRAVMGVFDAATNEVRAMIAATK